MRIGAHAGLSAPAWAMAALPDQGVRRVVVEVELLWDRARDPNGSASLRASNLFESARRRLCVGPLDHSGCERRPEVGKIQVLVYGPAQLNVCEEEHEEALVLVKDVRVP